MKKTALLRWLLLALIFSLVFEGVARKFFGPKFATPIFFLKDFIVLVIGCVLVCCNVSVQNSRFLRAFLLFSFLMFIPCVVTVIHDPLLAIFGLKQYLLFPIVALAVTAAFEDRSK